MRNFIGALMLFVLLAFADEASAGRFWSDDQDTNTAIVAVNALTVIDWAQTRYIADHSKDRIVGDYIYYGYTESGIAEQFIGKKPTTKEVNQYFVATLLLSNTIGYFLPESATVFGMHFNPKKTFYVGLSMYEGYYVVKNFDLGLRLQF